MHYYKGQKLLKENCNVHVNHKALGGDFENTVELMISIGSSNIRKTKYASQSCNTLDDVQKVFRDTLKTVVLEDSHLSVYFRRYDT